MLMNTIHRKEPVLLFIGDICILILSLVLTLTIRYGSVPSYLNFERHLIPFSILFMAFLLVNFIAGLYEKHTLIFKSRLPAILLNVQIINAGLGVAFFYMIPFFSVSPKLFLFMYLIINLALMFLWRILIAPRLDPKKSQKAVLVGNTDEANELFDEINHNSRYHLEFLKLITPKTNSVQTLTEITDFLNNNDISMVIIDTRNRELESVIPGLYKFAVKGVLFLDMSNVYEDIFNRVPLSLVGQTWFVENMSSVSPKFVYDFLKRTFDIAISLIIGLITLILYPFIIIAVKMDGGAVFSTQDRIGHKNKIVRIYKFRTMTLANDEGKWDSVNNQVTKIGSFLRKTRIDELPQLWNVLKGDISLVGPRPELPGPVNQYAEKIPYYNIRHTVKPGLSGWAQIYHDKHPHHGLDIEETRNKLSYDLYYIKHRSLMLDLKIALRTIKVLITFVGR